MAKVNVSLNEREKARLERLAALRGEKFSRVFNAAVVHMLASIEADEEIHYVVPSEQQQQERRPAPPSDESLFEGEEG